MYTAFFGLREKPFALSPDPRFLYLSESHREALAHLLYGIEQGEGFIAVTGEVGTGKTTLCRTLLRRLGSDVEVAFLFNPKLSAAELLEAILGELGAEPQGNSARERVDQLNRILLEREREGRRVLLIVDEAQGMSAETLEQIRLLSNLETERDKLIQILLLGQPELDVMLGSASLRQLRQRIGVRWTLTPLGRDETAAYVRHRLRVAAGEPRDLFTAGALRELHRRSQGIPRLLNLLADRALLSAYGDGKRRVDAACVRQAYRELRGERTAARRGRWLAPALVATVLALLAGFAWQRGGLPLRAWLAPGGDGVESLPALTAPQPPEPAPATVALGAASEPAALVAPPPPSEWIPSLSDALSRRPPGETAAEALAALLDAWGVAPAEGVPQRIAVNDLEGELLSSHGLNPLALEASSLVSLRALGQPALLRLRADDGVDRWVALTGLDEDRARLNGVDPGAARDVSTGELERVWSGEARVVWRDFEQLPPVLRLGDRGEPVAWLQEALAELGFYVTSRPGSFDASTELAVRAFQADRRLSPDGAVGPQTQMQLYRDLPDYRVPRLLGNRVGASR